MNEIEEKPKQKWLLIDVFMQFNEDKCFISSAALSYYTALSLSPMLIFFTLIGNLFLSDETETKAEALFLIEDTAGKIAAELIRNIWESQAAAVPNTIFTAVLMLLGATTVFSVLHNTLNTIWNLNNSSSNWAVVKEKALALLMLFICGLLLVALVVLNMALSVAKSNMASFQDFIGSVFKNSFTDKMMDSLSILQESSPNLTGELISPEIEKLFHQISIVESIVSFVVVNILFALIFKVLSHRKFRWKTVFLGAFFTAALFWVGKYVISVYLANDKVTALYGTAGSMAIFLIWVYYSSAILFFGAEFIKVYAQRKGELAS